MLNHRFRNSCVLNISSIHIKWLLRIILMQVISIHEFTHYLEIQIQSSDSFAYLDRTFFIASKLNPDNILLERIFPLLSTLNLKSVLNHIEFNILKPYLIIWSLSSTTWKTSWSSDSLDTSSVLCLITSSISVLQITLL